MWKDMGQVIDRFRDVFIEYFRESGVKLRMWFLDRFLGRLI